jgi:hypothetical protein
MEHGAPASRKLNLSTHEVNASPRGAGTPRAWTWAALMRRVFDLDVLASPHCGGRLRVIAIVQDPLAVHAILAHRGSSLCSEAPGPALPVPAASSSTCRAASPQSLSPGPIGPQSHRSACSLITRMQQCSGATCPGVSGRLRCPRCSPSPPRAAPSPEPERRGSRSRSRLAERLPPQSRCEAGV